MHSFCANDAPRPFSAFRSLYWVLRAASILQTVSHAAIIDGRATNSQKEIFMYSFTVQAVGNLAKNPELNVKGDTTFTRFCLVGNDYAGKDEEGNAKEAVTSLYLVAFGGLGEAIARNARKGDQLIVQAHIRADNWTDKEGEMQYDYSFVADTFRFGAPGKAKREELARREEHAVGAFESET
jgi:single-strand DNA-binding protein